MGLLGHNVNVWPTAKILLLTGVLTLGIQKHAPAEPNNSPHPPSFYVDKGVCPFECCTYRMWQTTRPVEVYDSPNGKRIDRVPKGAWVRAITGETHSTPRLISSTFDAPEDGIRKGDPIYVLHYSGEGYWKVWVKGRTVDELFDLPKAQEPQMVWWVQIKAPNKHPGWVVVEDNFTNQDACG